MPFERALIFAASILLLASCAAGNDRPAAGGKLRVMASTPALASLAMAVGGEDADVEMLIAEDASPHAYQPTITDRRRLQDARLLLVNGLKLEPWDVNRLARAAGVTLVDCSAGITRDWLIGDEDGEYNPHVWLSTDGAYRLARAIAEAMATADPPRAGAYRKRLEKLHRRLSALHDEFAPRLAALKKRRFVSNHDAFPYFAREFGLRQVGVIQRTPGANPSIQERRQIERVLKENGADAIFMEPGFNDAASRTIAADAGLPLATLDPFGVGKPAPGALENVLRKDLQTVLETLGD